MLSPCEITIITMLAFTATTDTTVAGGINGFWQAFAILTDFRLAREADFASFQVRVQSGSPISYR
jgi:hypothetical protein